MRRREFSVIALHRAERRSGEDRECLLCLGHIPRSEGIQLLQTRALLHLACWEEIEAAVVYVQKPRSRRLRLRVDLLRAITAIRLYRAGELAASDLAEFELAAPVAPLPPPPLSAVDAPAPPPELRLPPPPLRIEPKPESECHPPPERPTGPGWDQPVPPPPPTYAQNGTDLPDPPEWPW